MERSRDEVVGVVGEVVDEAVLGLKQRFVFGCSLGRELWRCTVPILDSMLVAMVEPPASPVFFLSSSTTRGSSEICQKKSWVLVRNALGHTLTVTNFTGST